MKAFDARSAARALTGDLNIRAFNDEIREKRAMCLKKALSPALLAELFEFSRLESLLASETIPLTAVDIFDNGQLIRLVDMQHKSGKTGLAIVAARFSAGSTIRVRDIDSFDPRLGAFRCEIQRLFSASSQINLYLTPPARHGFAPHFDTTDVLVLQCLGAKEWRVYEDYTNRIDLPLMDVAWDPDRFRPLSVPDPLTLSAGDVLYMPRGVMHEAFCIQQESMHLTISLEPLTLSDLIARELQRIAAGNVHLRQRVPWSFEEDGNLSEHAATLVQDCLRDLSSKLDIEAALAAERHTLGSSGNAGQQASDLTRALETLRRQTPATAAQVS